MTEVERACNEAESESTKIWGCSSAGRAPALHAGGQEFDPPQLHQMVVRKNIFAKGLQSKKGFDIIRVP